MKTTSQQKIKTGLFTFAGLLVLVLGVFFIGDKQNLFSSTFQVYGIFKNVSGLQAGNNVRFAGINVGVVEDINIVNDSSVRVDLTINSKVQKFIKKDSRLSIGSDGLMGDKLVVIAPGGVNSQAIVADGGRLTTTNPVDVDKLMKRLSDVADNAATLTQGLSSIVSKVNNGQGSIGKLLNNDKMAKDLDATVKQAQTTIKTVHKTSSTLNEDLKAAQHNFLLRHFFKKKKEKAKEDSIKKAQAGEQKKQ